MLRRWGKWWLAGLSAWALLWGALVAYQRALKRSVDEQLVADLAWARADVAPSVRLDAMLDAVGAPRITFPSDPPREPTDAVSEKATGSPALDSVVDHRVATQLTVHNPSRACVVLAVFASELGTTGGADAARVAQQLIASADQRCGHGLSSLSRAELESLHAAARRRVEASTLHRRELAIGRREYRQGTIDEPVLTARLNLPDPNAGYGCGYTPFSSYRALFGPIARFTNSLEWLRSYAPRREREQASVIDVRRPDGRVQVRVMEAVDADAARAAMLERWAALASLN